jgi:hypothetical protein
MKVALAILLLGSVACRAQYEVSWWTIDSGGQTSGGGAYQLSGTIGQPDAGILAGGNYTLTGGFWGYGNRIESVPKLRIALEYPNVIVAWPNPSANFQLQVTPSLSAPNWSDVNIVPNVLGDEKQVTAPLQAGNQFFRLRKP